MISRDDIQFRAQLWNRVYDYLDHFFRSRGYIEVRTPLLVQSPGMEPNLDPIGVDIRILGSNGFLGRNQNEGSVARPSSFQEGELKGEADCLRGGLITSPEYSMKKLLGTGMEAIYTITPVFRNCEKLGERWSVEFTMLEWYRQHVDYRACMDETEELVNGLLGWEGKWQRISYVDEFEKICGFVPREESRDELLHLGKEHGLTINEQDAVHELIDQLFYALVWPQIKKEERYMLCEFPIPCASLARVGADGRYAERFEAFVGEIELCNGFTELVDADEQRRRFLLEAEERRSLDKEVFPIDEELLSRLSSIASPTYGNALGVDRLVMLAAGMKDIDSIHLFPPSQRF